MKTLRVVLKKKWFDMESDHNPQTRKDEEYRSITPFWIKRLMHEYFKDSISVDADVTSYFAHAFKVFDVYEARHGYQPDSPIVRRECLGITIGKAKPEWSDNWQGDVFVIKLGGILP